MDAIVEVTDANQATINAKGVGFKAFIPAVFARLVNEAFESRAKDEAASQGDGSRATGTEPQGPARPVGKRSDARAKCFRQIGRAARPIRLKSIQRADRRFA